MSGECKSYRLNEPMAWKEFKAMPDDIKVTYIKLLRQKFNVPVTYIAKMMGVTESSVRMELKKFGLTEGKGSRSGKSKWDKEGFLAWANGVDKLPTPVFEEEPIQEPVITSEEPEPYVEDDLPFDFVPVKEPDPELDELNCEINLLNAQVDGLQKANDALMESHKNDCQVIEKLRLLCSEFEEKVKILEAQMDVVRMIFGGK